MSCFSSSVSVWKTLPPNRPPQTQENAWCVLKYSHIPQLPRAHTSISICRDVCFIVHQYERTGMSGSGTPTGTENTHARTHTHTHDRNAKHMQGYGCGGKGSPQAHQAVCEEVMTDRICFHRWCMPKTAPPTDTKHTHTHTRTHTKHASNSNRKSDPFPNRELPCFAHATGWLA